MTPEKLQALRALAEKATARHATMMSVLAEDVVALLDEIERLHGSVLRPLTEREVEAALHKGRAEAMAATGDNAWTSLLNRLAAMTAARDEACDRWLDLLPVADVSDEQKRAECACIEELRKVGGGK